VDALVLDVSDSRAAAPRMGTIDFVLTILLAVSAAALLAFVTRTGLALKPDSVSYLGGAHALATGHGYTLVTTSGGRRAIVDFPPVYSIVLSGAELLGFQLLSVARILNLALFAGSGVLLYVLLFRTAAGSRGPAALATLAFILSPTLLPRFGFALSEPLFLFLLILTVFLLDWYLRCRKFGILAFAAISCGLACLTRLSGIALVVGGIAALFIAMDCKRGRRTWLGCVFASVAVAAMVGWSAWVATRPMGTSRSLGVHLAFQRLQNGYGVVAQWVFPEPIPSAVRVTLFGVLLVVGVYALARRALRVGPAGALSSLPRLPPAATVALCFGVAYVILLIVTFTFLDRVTRADARILSPLFVMVIALVVAILSSQPRSYRARTAITICASVIVALYAFTTLNDAFDRPIRSQYLAPRVLRAQGI
jgi:hypothetical protein